MWNNQGAELVGITREITEGVVTDVAKDLGGCGKRIAHGRIGILPGPPEIKRCLVDVAQLELHGIAAEKRSLVRIRVSVDATFHLHFVGRSVDKEVVKNRVVWRQ